jgi:hypothetical protein
MAGFEPFQIPRSRFVKLHADAVAGFDEPAILNLAPQTALRTKDFDIGAFQNGLFHLQARFLSSGFLIGGRP